MNTCIICKREYTYNRKKGHGKEKCNSCVVNTRRFAVKRRAVDYKGGKCIRCGYSKSLRALHFHHRDPLKKEFGIGSKHCYKWSRIQEELDKCDLLCSNCHAEIEHEIGGVAASGM